MKVCTKCNETKDISHFNRHKRRRDGYNNWCRMCCAVHAKAYYSRKRSELLAQKATYYEENKDKIKESKVDFYTRHPRRLKQYNLRRYGISLADFDSMLEIQENKCAICRDEFSDNNLPCVDHCHDSKQVRSLLCKWCNRGLGLFRDNPMLLRTSAVYLEIHKNLLTSKEKHATLDSESYEKENS